MDMANTCARALSGALRQINIYWSDQNSGVGAMKDMEAQLEKLRVDAEDCALISRLATDPKKQELFARLAKHLETLASEVERAIAENASKEPS